MSFLFFTLTSRKLTVKTAQAGTLIGYCWIPVPYRRENFTGLLNRIICHNLPNNGHFIQATLPFCNLTSILKLETLCFRIPKIGQSNELNRKARPWQIMQIYRPVKFSCRPGHRKRAIIKLKLEFRTEV